MISQDQKVNEFYLRHLLEISSRLQDINTDNFCEHQEKQIVFDFLNKFSF